VTEPLDDRAGTRQLHQRIPAVSEFLNSQEVKGRIDALIPCGFVVRSILFDKTPETNWRVPWHQDLSICVKKRLPGFSAWSIKEGVQHVHSPVEILAGMVTLRLHLDDCGEDNGPLRVIAGSHTHGRISPDEIVNWKSKGPIVSCTVRKGGAVIMKPLLLHSSSPAKNPNHRRVLHIEFVSEPLPKPLEWIS
jgi:ectoine hydroxylase-related dioxygenase (phytanoyl-CoA dioxygenase family)